MLKTIRKWIERYNNWHAEAQLEDVREYKRQYQVKIAELTKFEIELMSKTILNK